MSPRSQPHRWCLLTLLLLALAIALPACGGPSVNPRTKVAKSDAIIKLQCNVTSAELWVNDRFVAHVRNLRGGIALSPGQHRVEFRHDSHHTHYELLTVTTRERRTLTVTMAEILP